MMEIFYLDCGSGYMTMFINIYISVHLKRVNITIYKLCFNILVFERKGWREKASHSLVFNSKNPREKNFFYIIKTQGNLNTDTWFYFLNVIMVLQLFF